MTSMPRSAHPIVNHAICTRLAAIAAKSKIIRPNHVSAKSPVVRNSRGAVEQPKFQKPGQLVRKNNNAAPVLGAACVWPALYRRAGLDHRIVETIAA